MGESTPSVTIATENASALQTAISTYIGEITPMLLIILGAALAIGLLFWVVRVFMRGTKSASR